MKIANILVDIMLTLAKEYRYIENATIQYKLYTTKW